MASLHAQSIMPKPHQFSDINNGIAIPSLGLHHSGVCPVQHECNASKMKNMKTDLCLEPASISKTLARFGWAKDIDSCDAITSAVELAEYGTSKAGLRRFTKDTEIELPPGLLRKHKRGFKSQQLCASICHESRIAGWVCVNALWSPSLHCGFIVFYDPDGDFGEFLAAFSFANLPRFTRDSLQPFLESMSKEFFTGMSDGVWEVHNFAPAALPQAWFTDQIIAMNAKSCDKLIVIYKEPCNCHS